MLYTFNIEAQTMKNLPLVNSESLEEYNYNSSRSINVNESGGLSENGRISRGNLKNYTENRSKKNLNDY